MELDWTTFGLQVVNFLVLVWLLKRFLYRPVMDAIARRQATIDQSVADARAAERRAEELRTQYEARLAETDAAHADRLARLAEEIAAERRDRLAALDTELQGERDKRAALAERDAAERERQAEAHAQRKASAFAARLLGRLGDAHFDRRLLDLLIEDLPTLPAPQVEGLRAAAAESGARLAVTSARRPVRSKLAPTAIVFTPSPVRRARRPAPGSTWPAGRRRCAHAPPCLPGGRCAP